MKKQRRPVKLNTDVDKAVLPFMNPEPKVYNNKESFQNFHEEHPYVYEELKKLSLQLLYNAGRKKYSMKSLFEVLRWHRAIEKPQDDFKLNNIFTSWYSRKLMKEVPDLRGFFFTRDAKADNHLGEL